MKKKTTFVALLFCSLPLWSTNTVMQDGEPVELTIKPKDHGDGTLENSKEIGLFTKTI